MQTLSSQMDKIPRYDAKNNAPIPAPGKAISSIPVSKTSCPQKESKPVAQRQRIRRIMVGTGFCQTRQSILYFGTDDEMSDDEIRTETHPCIPATNIELGTVGQRRAEQTGDIKSPVQRQSHTGRKPERNESFDGKIEVGEPCGLIRIVVEDIVRSRGTLHREEKPRAKPPMF